MNDVISLIQQKYGDLCQLCPPLNEEQYPLAEKMLPTTLFEVLKISNGVLELMSLPNVDDGKPFPIGFIIDSFDGICSGSKEFNELFGMEGLAFAGNGAGGFYVMNPDGKIFLYEYPGEDMYPIFDSVNELYLKGHYSYTGKRDYRKYMDAYALFCNDIGVDLTSAEDKEEGFWVDKFINNIDKKAK